MEDPVKSSDVPIPECLMLLGISLLSDWDVLMFLYRHQFSLVNAEDIARLLGHPSKSVGEALTRLEASALIQRSRSSRGVRFYQFKSSGAEGAAGDCLRRLLSFAETRPGRLLLVKHLRQSVGLRIAIKGDLK